ncbi:MAG TPA: hypothetical protein PLQ11_08670 [Beijerinckiaceae bacterium]|mgnify:CR=1 FL=1|nr:hypothetical protein [Beijerinckiaceae bacterium]
MTLRHTGLIIAPILIAAMAVLMHRKGALPRGGLILVLAVVAAITAVLMST